MESTGGWHSRENSFMGLEALLLLTEEMLKFHRESNKQSSSESCGAAIATAQCSGCSLQDKSFCLCSL